MLVERCNQKVIGSIQEVIALEKVFDALETKIGNVPKKRRLMPIYAGVTADTMIWEREWESLSAIEAYRAKASNDNPEWEAAYTQAGKVFSDSKFELFEVIVLPD